jgi:serine/threonine-protein kinase
MMGDAGFSRIVAIKQLHGHLAAQPEVVSLLLDEARSSAQIRHANVVSTLDVIVDGGVVSLVQEYVEGVSLATLAKNAPLPAPMATAIAVDMLRGLHAAHEATNEAGEPLGIVHRDVSPQNVLVGIDGVARVIDFGVSKARGGLASDDAVHGKVAYMAPEQLLHKPTTRTVDIYAVGAVLWELLRGRRLVEGEGEEAINAALAGNFPPADAGPELDAVIGRALGPRFLTAGEMADALEALPLSRPAEVGRAVQESAEAELTRRRALLRAAHQPEEFRPLSAVLAGLGAAATPVKAKRALWPFGVGAAVLVVATLGAGALRREPVPPVSATPMPSSANRTNAIPDSAVPTSASAPTSAEPTSAARTTPRAPVPPRQPAVPIDPRTRR